MDYLISSFVGKQYYDDETSMLSAGIKGFASSEIYAVTFVLAAPIEKGGSQIKVTMTSPRDRKIDTTGRFCKVQSSGFDRGLPFIG